MINLLISQLEESYPEPLPIASDIAVGIFLLTLTVAIWYGVVGIKKLIRYLWK